VTKKRVCLRSQSGREEDVSTHTVGCYGWSVAIATEWLYSIANPRFFVAQQAKRRGERLADA